jgi:hypothetical protein
MGLEVLACSRGPEAMGFALPNIVANSISHGCHGFVRDRIEPRTENAGGGKGGGQRHASMTRAVRRALAPTSTTRCSDSTSRHRLEATGVGRDFPGYERCV